MAAQLSRRFASRCLLPSIRTATQSLVSLSRTHSTATSTPLVYRDPCQPPGNARTIHAVSCSAIADRLKCGVFLIIIFGHACTSSSITTDKIALAVRVGGGGWWAGLYIPCVGRMAVDGVDDFFVILACSRWEVWGKFSSGTSLNKQCFSAYNNLMTGRCYLFIYF